MNMVEPSFDKLPDPQTRPEVGATLGLRVTSPRPGTLVVSASGEVDEATVARLDDVLAPRLVAAVRVMVLDLSAVDFLGVVGLQLLTRSHMRAADRGIALRVVATGHEVCHALHVAGLDTMLACHATVAEALFIETQESP